jgi:hypothetical protein
MQRDPEAKTGGLLRLLFLWLGAVPADPDGRQGQGILLRGGDTGYRCADLLLIVVL